MQLTLDLPEDLIKDIQFEADHQGISLEEWLHATLKSRVWRRALHDRRGGERPHISELILENMKDVPPEELPKHPKDGASEHDHYIYGTPKRNG